MLRQRLAEALTAGRAAAGLSLRLVASDAGLSPDTIRRVERGDPGAMSIDGLASIAQVLGLELVASLYPSGDPVRDRAHLALLERFRVRLGPAVRWRVEVPMPIAGDLRSADAMIGFEGCDAVVEAETHLGDIQLIERKASAKQRDLGADRLILLVSDTRHNREVIRLHPELHRRFPLDTRTCLRRLRRGANPEEDALVVL
jgi:transcriptional regulator with XRE-family HTH domain